MLFDTIAGLNPLLTGPQRDTYLLQPGLDYLRLENLEVSLRSEADFYLETCEIFDPVSDDTEDLKVWNIEEFYDD